MSEFIRSFTYWMKGKEVALSYWLAPDVIFDNPDEACVWARRSFEVALRAHTAKAQWREKVMAKKRILS